MHLFSHYIQQLREVIQRASKREQNILHKPGEFLLIILLNLLSYNLRKQIQN